MEGVDDGAYRLTLRSRGGKFPTGAPSAHDLGVDAAAAACASIRIDNLQVRGRRNRRSGRAARVFVRTNIVAGPLGAGDFNKVILHFTERRARMDGRACCLQLEIALGGIDKQGVSRQVVRQRRTASILDNIPASVMEEAGVGGDQTVVADDQAAEGPQPGDGPLDYPTIIPLY
jgi:hypothetical protein